MNLGLQSNTGSRQFLNFSEALNHLRWGERIARRSWNKDRYIQIQYRPTDNDNRIICYPDYCVPSLWNCTVPEILAEDWYVLGEHE